MNIVYAICCIDELAFVLFMNKVYAIDVGVSVAIKICKIYHSSNIFNYHFLQQSFKISTGKDLVIVVLISSTRVSEIFE